MVRVGSARGSCGGLLLPGSMVANSVVNLARAYVASRYRHLTEQIPILWMRGVARPLLTIQVASPTNPHKHQLCP
jgi:hypothetical protein